MSEQPPLKNKSHIHTARKLWHMGGVLLILGIYINVSRALALQLMGAATLVFLVGDWLRLFVPPINKALFYLFQPVMREKEKNHLAGTSYMLMGVLLVMALFPRDIVVLALLFVGIADPIAGFVGVRHGKDKIVHEKSLQGSAAAFGVCATIAAIFFSVTGVITERLVIVTLLSGLIGAIAELLPLGHIDDNFSFPVVSAGLLWLLFYVFGGF